MLDVTQLERDILSMNSKQLYCHLASALGITFNAERGTDEFKAAVKIIKTHEKLFREHQFDRLLTGCNI